MKKIFVVVILALTLVAYQVDKYVCKVKWEQSGKEWKYQFAAGCMIKTKDGWISDKFYRSFVE